MTKTDDTERDPQSRAAIPVDMRDSGLLWLLNTTALHPQGLAVSVDESGNLWLMHLSSEEPVVFDEATAIVGHSKWRAALARLAARVKTLETLD